jgi:hypothetical protein
MSQPLDAQPTPPAYVQVRFAELLEFRTAARVLALQGNNQTQRQALLEQFRTYCQQHQPPLPSSLIDFQQSPERSALRYAQALVADLNVQGVAFATWDALDLTSATAWEWTRALLSDLKAASQMQPLVVLIDAFDQGSAQLQRWLCSDLLDQLFFQPNTYPATVVLVVAGREVPDFRSYWALEDCAVIIEVVPVLPR